jgi:hypothetical protein
MMHRRWLHLGCGDAPSRRLAWLRYSGLANWLTVSCAIGLSVGCGGDNAVHPVRGHVQAADGRRPTFGTVELKADTGGLIASGKIEQDGSFRLSTYRNGDGAVAGRHRAIIVQMVNTEHLPLEKHHHVLDIHPRYARYETSGLEFTIKAGGQNDLEIVVDEAPRKAPGPQP